MASCSQGLFQDFVDDDVIIPTYINVMIHHPHYPAILSPPPHPHLHLHHHHHHLHLLHQSEAGAEGEGAAQKVPVSLSLEAAGSV